MLYALHLSNKLTMYHDRARTGLLLRLLQHFSRTLFIQALYASLYGVLTFVSTLLLRSILRYLEGESDASIEQAWLHVILLFIASILSAVIESRAIWIGQKVGLRLRSILMSEIYAKSLKRRITHNATGDQLDGGKTPKRQGRRSTPQADIGTIMSLLTTDAYKIADAGANMHQVWGSVPVQIFMAITLLYLTLGISAVAGVAIMVGMVPLNSRIAQRFGAIQMEVLAASDARIQATNEMVRSIRVIKFFAWVPLFEQKINGKRATELRALRGRYVLWSRAATIWYGMPLLITFSSFLVYAIMIGQPLVPSLTFACLSLFNLLKLPLDEFVGMLARLQDSLVSVKRVESFLEEEEMDKYEQLLQQGSKASLEIGFQYASFSWGDHAQEDAASSESSYRFILRHLNNSFMIGKLNIITGATASGKSSMLLALLGEMTLVEGTVRMPAPVNREHLPMDPDTKLINAVAYCAQEAWLINDTIRNNILFGCVYEEDRYRTVMSACGLNVDL